MPCYTRVEIQLEDNAINRKARENLGLPIEGSLGVRNARRVKIEAGVIRTTQALHVLSPSAIVVRKGNKLQVTVST